MFPGPFEAWAADEAEPERCERGAHERGRALAGEYAPQPLYPRPREPDASREPSGDGAERRPGAADPSVELFGGAVDPAREVGMGDRAYCAGQLAEGVDGRP